MKPMPTTEERVWAVLAHLSALAFGMGILLPVIGWSEQRRKSNYVSFHSLQALGYQALGFTLWLLILLLLAFVLILILLIVVESGVDQDAFGMIFKGVLILAALVIVLYVAFPVIAAIQCILGQDPRYPILGVRLARYLGYPAPADD